MWDSRLDVGLGVVGAGGGSHEVSYNVFCYCYLFFWSVMVLLLSLLSPAVTWSSATVISPFVVSNHDTWMFCKECFCLDHPRQCITCNTLWTLALEGVSSLQAPFSTRWYTGNHGQRWWTVARSRNCGYEDKGESWMPKSRRVFIGSVLSAVVTEAERETGI